MAQCRLIRKNNTVLTFKNIEEISDFVIKKWRDISKQAIKERNRFVVALSGGKTPTPLYKKIVSSKNSFAWNKTHIFLVDERFISFDDPESNYGIIKENLINRVNIPEENIHPIQIGESAQVSAKIYEADIKRFFNLKEGEYAEFDLVMLGIGEDGHTASLFGGDGALNEKRHLSASVNNANARHERITLTFPVINKANNIIFLATGKNKAKIIKEIIEENNISLPVSLVKSEQGKIYFLLDEDAGSLINFSA